MTSMTPEDVHDLLIREMKNLSLPAPVERTLYSDMRNLCNRLWSEYESLDEKSDAERRRIVIINNPKINGLHYIK